MRTPLALVALALAASTLAACSSEGGQRAVDPAAQGSGGSAPDEPGGRPSAIPAAEGEVQTATLATVLDDGDGPQLCLGGVAESMPPQCDGLPMEGWDWAEQQMHESAGGTRWGLFHLRGTFDGTTFTVGEVVPAALYDPMADLPEDALATPCPEPEGGWRVLDPASTTNEALDATFNAASALPGYVMAWMDQARDPRAANDPTKLIINVAVTGDPAEAEAKLRETWGGKLCVSTAELTERELTAIQAELRDLPGLLGSGSTRPDHLDVDVVHDDGTIQAWVDEQYGAGLVSVNSALVPVETG